MPRKEIPKKKFTTKDARFIEAMAYLRELDCTRRTLQRLHEIPFVVKALKIAAGLEKYT